MKCTNPFKFIEVHRNGVFPCCPDWCNRYSLGDIFTQTAGEIWHGERAQVFRELMRNEDWLLCDRSKCLPEMSAGEGEIPSPDKPLSFPEHVKFCHDHECNSRCQTCRDTFYRTPENELEQLNARITDVFLPLLKNATIAEFSGSGDPFGSRHYRRLIRAAAKAYPDLHFDFHTNGLSCTETMLRKLGVEHRVRHIRFSIHAASEPVYAAITRASFARLRRNVEEMARLKREKKIGMFSGIFVLQKANVHELAQFVDWMLASEGNAIVWEVKNWGGKREIWKTFADMDVTREDNPLHGVLLEQLQRLARVPADRLHLSPRLRAIADSCLHSCANAHITGLRRDSIARDKPDKLFLHTFYAPEGDAVFQAFRNRGTYCYATPHDRRLLAGAASLTHPLSVIPKTKDAYPVFPRFQEYAPFFYPSSPQISWNIENHGGRINDWASRDREYLKALGTYAHSKGRIPVFWLDGGEGMGTEKFGGKRLLIISDPASAWHASRENGDRRWQDEYMYLLAMLGFREPENADALFNKDRNTGWKMFCEAWALFNAFQAAFADVVIDMESLARRPACSRALQKIKEIAGFTPDFSFLENEKEKAGAPLCPAVGGAALRKWLGTPARQSDLLLRIKAAVGELPAAAATNLSVLMDIGAALPPDRGIPAWAATRSHSLAERSLHKEPEYGNGLP